MRAQDQTNEKSWETAVHWVNNNPNIKMHVNKRHYLMYSPHEMSDFVVEAYFAAYEALSHPSNFEQVFWRKYKIRCGALANAPHGNYFVDISNVSIEQVIDNDEDIDIDDDAYVDAIVKVLNMLTPSQRQLCRVIAFADKPVSTEFLAKAFNITPSAVSQRISAIVKKINTHKELYGVFYDDGEIL